MKRFFLTVVLAGFYFVGTAFAQSAPAEKLFEIKGAIKNQDKTSLAGLNLYFASGEFRKLVVSDEDGGFIAQLPVGKYEVTANAAVSKTFVAFIEIFDNNLNPTDFELILETEKFCCSPMSNGNATEVIKYVAPSYPAAALAMRVAGEIVVFVKIDQEGNVISAEAESGHPLLRPAGKQAAKSWTFSIDKNAAERKGKIVFAFVITEKKQSGSILLKPNRLEVFILPTQIQF